MKTSLPRRSLIIATLLLIAGGTPALAQAPAPAAPAAPAGGGGGRGGPAGTPGLALPAIDLYNAVNRSPILNDTELTQITRVEEVLEREIANVAAARTALSRAVFTVPTNPQDIAAKVRTLADAEYALAVGRADSLSRLKSTLKATTPAKSAAIVMALTNPVSNGTAGGGGRGGGGAPAAAAPATGAPAAGRGGN